MTQIAGPNPAFLEATDIHVSYPVLKGFFVQRAVARVHAVRGVSLRLQRGEALGLVGESGCGKTTLARVILGILRPNAGEVLLDGVDMTRLEGAERRSFRRRVQMVFQDPYDSLDGRMTVGDIVGEGLAIHNLAKGAQYRTRVGQLLEQVHLSRQASSRYPREFSGGQRQRIAIARALAVEPQLMVLDEPVSALDVSVQAQILNLLDELRRERNLSFLFIAHDLAVVRHLCDRIAVMYLGKIVERSDTEQLIKRPLHPYTQALLSAVPPPEPAVGRARILLEGDIPLTLEPPPGCAFHPRCPVAQDICRTVEPPLEEKERGRSAACHLVVQTATGAVAPDVAAVATAHRQAPQDLDKPRRAVAE